MDAFRGLRVNLHHEVAEGVVGRHGRLLRHTVECFGRRAVQYEGIHHSELDAQQNQQDAEKEVTIAGHLHGRGPLIENRDRVRAQATWERTPVEVSSLRFSAVDRGRRNFTCNSQDGRIGTDHYSVLLNHATHEVKGVIADTTRTGRLTSETLCHPWAWAGEDPVGGRHGVV